MLKKLLPVVVLLFLTACACPHFSGDKPSCCCKDGICMMDAKGEKKECKCECCKEAKCEMCLKAKGKATSAKDGSASKSECPMCLKAAKDKAATAPKTTSKTTGK
jgi:hypothetical protein